MNAATFVLVTALISGVGTSDKGPVAAPRAVDVARPVKTFDIGGTLGKRLEIWREHRLKRVGRDPFLLDGFRSPPGRPDGSLTALERGVPGILYRMFPDKRTTEEFPSWTHNHKAMVLPADEVYHNGTPSNHSRATNRRALP
jgi:hypothetical protein